MEIFLNMETRIAQKQKTWNIIKAESQIIKNMKGNIWMEMPSPLPVKREPTNKSNNVWIMRSYCTDDLYWRIALFCWNWGRCVHESNFGMLIRIWYAPDGLMSFVNCFLWENLVCGAFPRFIIIFAYSINLLFSWVLFERWGIIKFYFLF